MADGDILNLQLVADGAPLDNPVCDLPDCPH